ncbi:MAG: bifunctional ornithine acetyltransferase/N-acetylglutamate synthase [Pirellulales bacterium]
MNLPKGFRFAGIACGIKSRADRKDISLIVSEVPAVAAGVYTQNWAVAAPVTLCRSRTAIVSLELSSSTAATQMLEITAWRG